MNSNTTLAVLLSSSKCSYQPQEMSRSPNDLQTTSANIFDFGQPPPMVLTLLACESSFDGVADQSSLFFELHYDFSVRIKSSRRGWCTSLIHRPACHSVCVDMCCWEAADRTANDVRWRGQRPLQSPGLQDNISLHPCLKGAAHRPRDCHDES